MSPLETPGHGGPPLWVWRVLIALTFAVVVIVGIGLIINTGRSRTIVSQVRDLVVATQRSQARLDCRSEYNAIRQSVVDQATAVSRQANIDFAGYLLGRPDSTEAVILKDRDDLITANDAVLALPMLPEMVDKGFSLDGARHPPCPKVK